MLREGGEANIHQYKEEEERTGTGERTLILEYGHFFARFFHGNLVNMGWCERCAHEQ